MLLSVYKGFMQFSRPLVEHVLRRRARLGKEDVSRAGERRGQAGLPRPPGRLVWMHAASVGESMSLLAVIDRLLQADSALHILVTTGTVTSARMMKERLPARAIHQYVPVDRPAWVESFLDHWRPDLVLWAESDLWPAMLSAVGDRKIPAVQISARMSAKSFRRWKTFAPGMIRKMLSAFSLSLAQNPAEGERLSALGAPNVKVSTNLKYAAEVLPHDQAELARLAQNIAGRSSVLWSSTHATEEDIALRAHLELRERFPGLLTVIVPRHPKRAEEIEKLAQGMGLKASLRSRGSAPDRDVYVADTLGEMGLFYRLCRTVVVCGSFFVNRGGHNLIEAGQLGCIILFGPDSRNFQTVIEDFKSRNAVIQVENGSAVVAPIADILANPEKYEIGRAHV